MADKTSEQEPSIEEILASIRQIISDDDDTDNGKADAGKTEPAPPPPPVNASKDDIDAMFAAPAPKPEPVYEPEPDLPADEDGDDDILDLTEPVAEPFEEALPTQNDHSAAQEDNAFELALQDIRQTLDKEETQAMPPSSPIEETILNEATRQAAIASMAKLTGHTPVNRPQSPEAPAGVTLEDIVRDLLHPMLRDWVNVNLPPIVERVVQKELEKLARQALDQ